MGTNPQVNLVSAIQQNAAGAVITQTYGKPRPFDDNEDYYCPYSIEHVGQKKVSYAGGMDAVQALTNTQVSEVALASVDGDVPMLPEWGMIVLLILLGRLSLLGPVRGACRW